MPDEWVDEHQYDPAELDATVPGYDYGTSKTAQRYDAMRDALLEQNRTIQYSLCAWGHAHVEQWGNSTGHSWRMWGDIYPEWAGKYQWSWGLMPIVNQAAKLWNTTGFWGHNDWDMLEVGNGNLTFEENRSHFALWAGFKSPLIIGTPLDAIEQPILDILSNKELVAFNQDRRYSDGIMPFDYGGSFQNSTEDLTHPPSRYVGTSTAGIHLFLLNPDDAETEIRVDFRRVPGLRNRHRAYLVHDMWTGEDIGVFKNKLELSVKKHDTAALRLTTVDGEFYKCEDEMRLIELLGKHPNPDWTPTSLRG